jgi:hypothetical protein
MNVFLETIKRLDDFNYTYNFPPRFECAKQFSDKLKSLFVIFEIDHKRKKSSIQSLQYKVSIDKKYRRQSYLFLFLEDSFKTTLTKPDWQVEKLS